MSSAAASPIRFALAGVGNCASSLLQGIALAHQLGGDNLPGLMSPILGGYRVTDLLPVAAFDIDTRKVGCPLRQAVFAEPNNARLFCRELPPAWDAVTVSPAPALDGVAAHLASYPPAQRVEPLAANPTTPADIVQILKTSGAQVLVNYLPVGSQKATEIYAEACLRAGVAMVNCIPVFLASDPEWGRRFTDARLPLVGDDVKSQLGATILHRTLARLFESRGLRITGSYQLNTAGNTDFLNMLDRSRLASKKRSKTQSVQSQLTEPIPDGALHIGPSDYVGYLKDNKVAFLRLEAEGFAGMPLNVEVRLSVEDSPNSAGCVVDAIRAARIALDRGIGGPLEAASAWLMKSPPVQMTDDAAQRQFANWAK